LTTAIPTATGGKKIIVVIAVVAVMMMVVVVRVIIVLHVECVRQRPLTPSSELVIWRRGVSPTTAPVPQSRSSPSSCAILAAKWDIISYTCGEVGDVNIEREA
jgi:hypothetical protein